MNSLEPSPPVIVPRPLYSGNDSIGATGFGECSIRVGTINRLPLTGFLTSPVAGLSERVKKYGDNAACMPQERPTNPEGDLQALPLLARLEEMVNLGD